jgi:hypothetical protein
MALTSPTARQLVTSFRAWLKSADMSPSTCANYIVDVNKYLSTVTDSQIFSPPSLQGYITAITGQNNYRRQLASLAKFCQFALDQQVIPQNPLTYTDQDDSIKPLLNEFKSYLQSQNVTQITIKNYLNDVQQFISWFQSQKSSLFQGESGEAERV